MTLRVQRRVLIVIVLVMIAAGSLLGLLAFPSYTGYSGCVHAHGAAACQAPLPLQQDGDG